MADGGAQQSTAPGGDVRVVTAADASRGTAEAEAWPHVSPMYKAHRDSDASHGVAGSQASPSAGNGAGAGAGPARGTVARGRRGSSGVTASAIVPPGARVVSVGAAAHGGVSPTARHTDAAHARRRSSASAETGAIVDRIGVGGPIVATLCAANGVCYAGHVAEVVLTLRCGSTVGAASAQAPASGTTLAGLVEAPQQHYLASTIAWIAAQCHGHVVGTSPVHANDLVYGATAPAGAFDAAGAPAGSGVGAAAGNVGTYSGSTGTALPNVATFGGARGKCMFASPAHIVCCDLVVTSHEEHTFLLKVQLPPQLPPTFRGSLFRFVYMLTVGFQRGTSATQVMHLPLPVTAAPAPAPAAPIGVLCMARDGVHHTQGCAVSSEAVDTAAHARRHSRARVTALRVDGGGAGGGGSSLTGGGSGGGGGESGVDALDAGLARALGRRRRAARVVAPEHDTAVVLRAFHLGGRNGGGSPAPRGSGGETTPGGAGDGGDGGAGGAAGAAAGGPQSFAVTSNGVHLGKVSMQAAVVHPGSVLRLYLDFTGAEVTTYQVAVRLQCGEQVMSATPRRGADDNGFEAADVAPPTVTHSAETSADVVHMYTEAMQGASVLLNVPITAAPSFYSHLFAVSWALEFHFTVRSTGAGTAGTPTDSGDGGGGTEVLLWRVPVVVAPRTPPATVPGAKASSADTGAGACGAHDHTSAAVGRSQGDGVGGGGCGADVEAARAVAEMQLHATVAMAKHMRAAARREVVLHT